MPRRTRRGISDQHDQQTDATHAQSSSTSSDALPPTEVSLHIPSVGVVKDSNSIPTKIPKFTENPLHYFTWRSNFLIFLGLLDLDCHINSPPLTKAQLDNAEPAIKKEEKNGSFTSYKPFQSVSLPKSTTLNENMEPTVPTLSITSPTK